MATPGDIGDGHLEAEGYLLQRLDLVSLITLADLNVSPGLYFFQAGGNIVLVR